MRRLAAWSCFALVLLTFAFTKFHFRLLAARADEPAAAVGQDADPELERQQKTIERFLSVLEKNPRRGTAFDKVYGFYVENGQLDALVERYASRTKQNASDGPAWMILGLLESQRGRDAAAAEAFQGAAKALPDDAMASFLLGQSLLLVGQTDKAVEALEQAIARKPAPTDLLPIFQTLGRIHQRAQRTDKALETWNRLEALFPDDLSVKEQIAAILAEEGQIADALPRYEALAKALKDDYRASLARIEAAELKVKANRASEGVSDLESLLSTLNPTGWLHREVRRRIEEVFMRSEDNDGLTKYYEKWIEKNPEDVDAIARLSRVLARQARMPEAQKWLEKALALAPSRKELRLAFIQQLVEEQRFPLAIAQYQLLHQAEPTNPDYLREWGKLILRDTSQPKEARVKAAGEVWRKMIAARPKDALVATQVADLFRQAEQIDDAIALYKKAVELAPNDPQYREFLGEYYHQLKRPDDALATWRAIAEGENRTATNLARLAEVFSSFGYSQKALPEIAAATELDPKDFTLALKAAEFHLKADKAPEALGFLTKAEALAQNDEEREGVLKERILAYQAEDSLADRIEEAAKQVAAKKDFANLYLLARLQQADRRYPEAMRAIADAIELQPRSTLALASAAKLYEEAGSLQEAADAYRKLAGIDRRSRGDYLRQVATLESALGRAEKAMDAGRELILSAPGNVEHYEFFSELCFKIGKTEEGLQALRKAMRINPTEPSLAQRLGDALARDFKTPEAIELYWNAFEKTHDLDGKLGLIAKLTDLYLQTNRFDRLLERLERMRSDDAEKREAIICLAQAHQTAGDLGMARIELESLLSDATRDTQLLQQLSKLAEAEGSMANAVKYQQQLVQIAPGPETEYRLATLLSRNGDTEESAAILMRLTVREEDAEKFLRNVDALTNSDQFETALQITEAKLRDDPNNWEILYRNAFLLEKLGKHEAAISQFEAILKLDVEDSTPGVALKAAQAKAAKSATGGQAAGQSRFPFRMDSAYEVARATNMAPGQNVYYSAPGRARPTIWNPSNYGGARMGAIGWLYQFAILAQKGDEFLARYQKQMEQAEAAPRAMWDWYYLASLRNVRDNSISQDGMRAVVLRLAQRGDAAAGFEFLRLLMQRGSVAVSYGGNAAQPTVPTLNEEELKVAVESLEKLKRAYGPQLASASLQLTTSVAAELRRAGKTEEADRIAGSSAAAAPETAQQLAMAYMAAAAQEDQTATTALLEKWVRAAQQQSLKPNLTLAPYIVEGVSRQIGKLAGERRDAAVLKVLDLYLDFNTHRAAKGQASVNRTPARRTGNAAMGVRYMFGANMFFAQLTYPTPNEMFDQGGISVLRCAYEVFKRNDDLGELEEHLQARAEKAKPADAPLEKLGLAYFYHWDGQKELAGETMSEASRLAPRNQILALEAAQLQTEMGQFEAALALADSITPMDQDAMRDREIMALNLAARLGDTDRAKQAAERLFGLRLDAETQIELASVMRRLSMNEHADAILARAQRSAGSRIGALVSLMGHSQSQGNTDMAVQIAHQILRRSQSPAAAAPQVTGRPVNEGAQARQAALQTLAATGKLASLIETTEKQLERSPDARQIREMLAEYYRAAGNTEKAIAEEMKLAKAQNADPASVYELAQKLAASGKAKEACDQYLIALRKQPGLMQRNYWEVGNTFQQANRNDELVKFFMEVDLRQLGQSYAVQNLVQNMVRNKAQQAQGLALFKRLWESFPAERSNLINQLGGDDNFWQMPEVAVYIKQAVLPEKSAAPQPGQSIAYFGIDNINSFGPQGTPNTSFRRLLESTSRQKEFPKLRAEIEKTMADVPGWKAGPLMLAIIDARTGSPDLARAPISKALETDKAALPYAATWILGFELEGRGGLSDLVIKLYEHSAQAMKGRLGIGFSHSVSARLVQAYASNGQRDLARTLLLEGAKPDDSTNYDPAYASYRQVSNLYELAQLSANMGFQAEAVRFYRECILAGEVDKASGSQFASSSASFVQRAERELQNSLATFARQSASSPQTVVALLASRNAADKPYAIDLMLSTSVNPQGLPQLESTLLNLLVSAKLKGETLKSCQSKLDEIAAANPESLEPRIVAAWLALEKLDKPAQEAALNALAAVVKSHPLEKPEKDRRPSARQRESAEPRMAVWLVARKCFERQEWREMGERLSVECVAAAELAGKANLLHAMLFDRGNAARIAGNKEEMIANWSKLVEVALQPPVKSAKPGAAPSLAENVFAAPLTIDQFRVGTGVALLAAQHDAPELAAAALKRSLVNGLPIPAVGISRGTIALGVRPTIRRTASSGGVVTVTQVDAAGQAIEREAANRLQECVNVWQAKNYSASEMCAVLRSIVLPSGNLTEITFGEQPLDWKAPRSLAATFAEWAHRAGEALAIHKEISDRKWNGANASAACAVKVLLALNAGDQKLVAEDLKELAGLMDGPATAAPGAPVSHALAAVILRPELQEAATPLVAKALARMESREPEQVREPTFLVLRDALKRGDHETAKRTIADFMNTVQANSSRYSGGDYGLVLQRTELARILNVTARDGDLATNLDLLAQYVDFPSGSRSQTNVNISTAIAQIDYKLRLRPATELYPLLRDWTLPNGRRATLRFAFGLAAPPEFDGSTARDPNTLGPRTSGIITNFAWLIESAEKAGTLDEVAKAAVAAEQAKQPQAGILLLMVQKAQRQPNAAFVTARMKAAVAGMSSTQNSESSYASERQIVEAMITWEAAQVVPELAAQRSWLATRLIEDYCGTFRAGKITPMLAMAGEDALVGLNAAERRRAHEPELKFWTQGPSTVETSAYTRPVWMEGSYTMKAAPGIPDAWWSAHDGMAVHVTGPGEDSLYFRYPLGGEFEFECDARMSSPVSGNMAFGGLLVVPAYWPSRLTIVQTLSRQESLNFQPGIDRYHAWNRLKFRSTPNSYQYFINGHMLYENTNPSPSSPWLQIYSFPERRAIFKNLKLTGDLKIPREVPLSHGARLTGWTGTFFGKTLARELDAPVQEEALLGSAPSAATLAPAAVPAVPFVSSSDHGPTVTGPDWSSEDGVIVGKFSNRRSPQSLLQYVRPLLPGETLRYEFLVEPGVTMVHPTIGASALLLEPSGVRTLPLVSLAQLTSGETVSAPDAVPGNGAPLSLKPKEWNELVLVVGESAVRLELNGQKIHEHPLSAQDDLRFGLFHFADQTIARVRNVTLRGDWPETLSEAERGDLFAHSEPESPELKEARRKLVGEDWFADGVDDVWRAGQTLEDEPRYALFKNWVLPSETHSTIRLQGLRPAVSTAPGGAAEAAYASPAWELARLAAQNNMLSSLREEAAQLASKGDVRNATAFQALLAIAEGEDAAAEKLLDEECIQLKAAPPELPIYERYAEMTVVHAALSRPALRAKADELTQLIYFGIDKKRIDMPWFRLVQWTAAKSPWLNDPATADLPLGPRGLKSKQWTAVSHPMAMSFARGYSGATWRLEKGVARFITGAGEDSLYFNIPLQGDFEIQFQKSDAPGRQIFVLYAEPGPMAEIAQEAVLAVKPPGQPLPTVAVSASPETAETKWEDCRIVIKDGERTDYTNGKLVRTSQVPANADPWLNIRREGADAEIRNLRILGTPTIPTGIHLSDGNNLGKWITTCFAEHLPGSLTRWQLQNGEITAPRIPRADRSYRQSLLQYHRPLADGDELSYEFMWRPGASEVHPALGQIAMMISAEGVRLHHITAADHDRSGLAPDNVFPLPKASFTAPIDLKTNDWNRVTLKIAGDEVILAVNSKDAARFKMDPANQKLFGFFRYADASAPHVRNVILRGDWPVKIPSVAEQELAAAPQE